MAKTIAIDARGRDAALVASEATADPETGLTTKQPAIRIISVTPPATLTTVVMAPPIRRPNQWIAVKTAIIKVALERGYRVTGCQRFPRNATAVTATYETVVTQASQSIHPTANPMPSPKARRAYTRNPPASGIMAANSEIDTAPINAYR